MPTSGMVTYSHWSLEKSDALVALLNELAVEAGQEEVSSANFLADLGHPEWQPSQHLLIAEDHEDVVGFVDVWLGKHEDTVRATARIGVAKRWRRRGIGSRLLREGLASLPCNVDRVDICVPQNATPLHEFLEHHEFEPVSVTVLMQQVPNGGSERAPSGYRWRTFAEWNNVEAFRLLHNQSFAGLPNWRPITTEAMRHYIGADWFRSDGLIVLEEGKSDVIVGWLWMSIDEAERNGMTLSVAFIESLGITPSHRGRALGRVLLRKAIAWAKAQDANLLELSADLENEPALGLYESVGFDVTRRSKWYSRKLPIASSQLGQAVAG